MLGDVNKLFVFKSLLTTPSNVLPLHLKQAFPHIIWIFTEGEGYGFESRLSSSIFSILLDISAVLTLLWHKIKLKYLYVFRYEEIFKQYNMPHKPVRVFTYLIGREISDLKAANWMACSNRGKIYIYLCFILYTPQIPGWTI